MQANDTRALLDRTGGEAASDEYLDPDQIQAAVREAFRLGIDPEDLLSPLAED